MWKGPCLGGAAAAAAAMWSLKWSHRRSDDRDSILADLDEEPDFSAAIKLQLDIIPVGKKDVPTPRVPTGLKF